MRRRGLPRAEDRPTRKFFAFRPWFFCGNKGKGHRQTRRHLWLLGAFGDEVAPFTLPGWEGWMADLPFGGPDRSEQVRRCRKPSWGGRARHVGQWLHLRATASGPLIRPLVSKCRAFFPGRPHDPRKGPCRHSSVFATARFDIVRFLSSVNVFLWSVRGPSASVECRPEKVADPTAGQ